MRDAPARVEGLQVSVKARQPMHWLEHVTAIAGAGFQGCRHAKPGNERAVLLVEIETLEDLGLAPGEIKENVTTRGIDLESLASGSQLRLGDAAVLEVSGPCHPCRRMDEIRPGLQSELKGRRGVNARVIVGGQVRVGDEILLLHAGRTR